MLLPRTISPARWSIPGSSICQEDISISPKVHPNSRHVLLRTGTNTNDDAMMQHNSIYRSRESSPGVDAVRLGESSKALLSDDHSLDLKMLFRVNIVDVLVALVECLKYIKKPKRLSLNYRPRWDSPRH